MKTFPPAAMLESNLYNGQASESGGGQASLLGRAWSRSLWCTGLWVWRQNTIPNKAWGMEGGLHETDLEHYTDQLRLNILKMEELEDQALPVIAISL